MSSQDEILELSDISSIHSNIQPIRKRSATSYSSQMHDTISNGTSVSEEITFTKSDVHSYRDKLKERFNTLKKQTRKPTASDRISLLKNSVRLLQKEDESEIPGTSRRVRSDDFEEYVFFCEEGEKANEDLEGDAEFLDSKLFKCVYAEQLSYVAKMQEKELLWQPRRMPSILLKEKVTTEMTEENRLDIGSKPKISKKELILLRHRLGTDEHIKWFDGDGSLQTLQSPHVNFSIRPCTKPLQLTQYCSATLKHFSPCDEIIIHGSGILDLQIISLTFKHHPLFSAEHVLQQKLIDFYDIHHRISSQNLLQQLSSKLDALRNSKEQLQKEAGDAFNITSVTKEIFKLRNRLFEEGKRARDALKGLLQTWKALKKLREDNGYSNTAIRLIIKKENVDFMQEKEIFEKQIEETISEVIQERSSEFQEQVNVYKAQLEHWNRETQKPKKPLKNYNEIEIKQEILLKFEECFKPPGEPKLHFELSYENEITSDVQDVQEKLRRNCVNTTKIWLKIFCNDLEVCKTKHVSLSDKFTCDFEENYSIQFRGSTANISIEIFEQPGSLLKRRIGDLIPPITNENDYNKLREEHFLKEEIVHYNKHGGVGSGIDISEIFSDSNLENSVLNTSGFVSYSYGWDFSEKPIETIRCESPLKCFDDVFDKNGMLHPEKLVTWVENLDPENPRDSILCDYIRSYADNISTTYKKFFRLNPLQSPLKFCDQTEIDRNIRFILLQHRNNNVPEFSGMLIPNRLKEIPFNILQNYLQRMSDLKHDFNYVIDDSVEVKRSRARKFLKQVFMNIFQQCRNSEDNVCFEDAVDEKYLAHFDLLVQTVIGKMVSLFSFQPSRVESHEISNSSKNHVEREETDAKNGVVKLVIHLQSGLNIPCRKNDDEGVRPFVVVECGEIEVASSIVDGTNCSWNEELVLPLESIHTDYLNPDSLNGSLTVRLFDDACKDTKRAVFLGAVEIPIAAICHSQMEGFLKIKIPNLLTDYTQSNEKLLSGSTASNIQHVPAQETYLLLKIYSSPILPKLSPSMEEWPCNETPYMKNHILRWNCMYNASNPSKKFSALVIDTNGRSCCITRYIRPLEPPQLNPEGFDVTPEQCARYVSMIPFTECNKFYENVCLTTDRLIGSKNIYRI